MKALVIWLIILLVLFLLAILKIGIRFSWEDEEARLQILVWKSRISLPKEKSKEKTEVPAVETKSVKGSEGTGGGKAWAMAALDHWQEILALVGRVLRTPTLDLLCIHVTVSSPDPAACALTYGRIWAAVGTILPVLERTFQVKRQDVQVQCDYEREKTAFLFRTEITVRIYEIVFLAAAGLRLFLRVYREIKNKKKAVQSA